MGRENVTIITTNDTNKQYTYPNSVEHEENPNLYELDVRVSVVLPSGFIQQISTPRSIILHVEKHTLEDAGVISMGDDRPIDIKPKESAEDLIIRLFKLFGGKNKMFKLTQKQNGFDLFVNNIEIFVRKGIAFSGFDYTKRVIYGPWFGQLSLLSKEIQETGLKFFDQEVKDLFVEFFKEGCCKVDKNDYVTAIFYLEKESVIK